jgi:hypothetical protein
MSCQSILYFTLPTQIRPCLHRQKNNKKSNDKSLHDIMKKEFDIKKT